jgi:[acyl-carrier-protein] S-malonyltransferase
MGRDAALASPAAREIFERADEVLGLPLSRICFEASGEDELLRTEIQQPAILTVSVALLRALEGVARLDPVCVAGHSLGEYTALVAARALPFEDAVRIVHARGRYMQEAVPDGQGAMAAVIGCAPETVEQACAVAAAQSGRVVAPANYNGPQQTVISGDAAAVELACARARHEGARRTVPLSVSAPFHCPLMAPAAEKLAPELSRVHFEDPRPPVVTNVEARANADGSRVPELLRAQVTAPVRFTEMVREMARLGVTRVLEIGPGRVLTGLVRRIAPAVQRGNLSLADELAAAARFAASGA